MTISRRRTIIAHGQLATRELRLHAARNRHHGVQIMSFEQLTVRLAGGFARSIDDESLRTAIQAVLLTTELGELESIKLLPGMVDAAADTLHKAWRAGIDLATRSGEHPRLDSIARLEAAVLAQLPPNMKRPTDLVVAACLRLDHAKTVLGPIEFVGITELSPCWRPLLQALTDHTPVIWTAGPRPTPSWLDATGVSITRAPPQAPAVRSVSAATTYHEAIEAIRWARSLLASGEAEAADIAIAAASTAEYDDYFQALRADANLDLHFVHGIKVTTTRDGQAAAALADILIRGLSQTRMRRLAALCGPESGLFHALPKGWMRILPTDAPLASASAWARLLDHLEVTDWPDEQDHSATLRGIIDLLTKGHSAADEIGTALLSGRALAIWRKALLAGPWGSLDTTLETLKQDDGLDACISVSWMPANALAASPRRFVRLIGLNSSRWPRGISEDRLISDHIIPTVELNPLPIGAADRRDFDTILATTEHQIVLSRARRDSEGRLLGRSSLLSAHGDEAYIRRNAVPVHAFSETDRLIARPQEFAHEPQAISATTGWRNWHRKEITPHDGLVRAGHPLLLAILGRTQSASSLRLLLRSPLGFVWRYGMRLRMPESSTEPLVLDALGMGDLVHMTLDLALRKLEDVGGLANANEIQIATAVQHAGSDVAAVWESERAIPPAVIWRRTLDDARLLTSRALTYGDERLPDGRSYGEVAFGGAEPKSDTDGPWDPTTPVEIPGTGFRIAGYIDRLDLSGDGKRALVRDYKTGRTPKDNISLDGGRELQRCLYAFAVKALLGAEVSISASLLFPRDQIDLQLADPEGTLIKITDYLKAARANLTAGKALVGPDTGGNYDDLAFALPANAGATYCKRKLPAATEIFGDAAQVWEAQ
ncbi:PD-(D/E)XK nuclease family protein [Dyella solisilvae]|uniref:PD-(D/E)XK nuclease family protein n=1 Tax=Dyella solisilvae TaxID=1920168 RepID=A0A370K8I7_9GAMM|nr:PD-(D/E)XK nuclease family protein [Dyella solisilvae]RDI98953.1 PD-(D/E)XK nuclease family protein [Dyella solisilvae]